MTAAVQINSPVPAFELKDWRGNRVRLADYLGLKQVILVFNRGFT